MQEPTRVQRWWNRLWPWQRQTARQVLFGLAAVLLAGAVMALIWQPEMPLYLGITVAIAVGGVTDVAVTVSGMLFGRLLEDRHQRKCGLRSRRAQ